MLFNSIDFLLFFPIVLLVYFVIPRKIKYIWLLVASYFFYMSWNASYALLIALSTVVTYFSGLFIDRITTKGGRRLIMILCLVINFGILFFFKYFDFAIANINRLLNIAHISTVSNPFSLLLPVGISFYTFQAVSYTIDIYRGEIKPEKNILKYALFVSFFPQLVAGPIERSGNLLEQIDSMENRTLLSAERLTKGFSTMVWGYFMKMVIADRISVFVDGVFDNLYRCGTVETLLGAFGFSIQIYCDFAGYSAIAIGAACILGFDLMENFNAPYFATGIKDFWRRWHISLSTWFRDYLYIPLGGNRKGTFRKYLNLLITFLVSGLWHGAGWTYIIWGGIHGIYQIVGDITAPIRKRINSFLKNDESAFSFKLGKILGTFILTAMAWVVFRATSFSMVSFFFNRMFTRYNPWALFDGSLFSFGLTGGEMVILGFALLILLFVDYVRESRHLTFAEALAKQNLCFRWVVLIGMIAFVLVFGAYGAEFDSNQFIYFTF